MLPGFEQIGIAVCVENLESDKISALIISMTNDFQPRAFIGDNRLRRDIPDPSRGPYSARRKIGRTYC